LYQRFRDWAKDGKVVFPLAETHYRENWKRANLDARWDTAVVMGLLSGFNTIGVCGLAGWDAMTGVCALAGVSNHLDVPDVLGWGMEHCLRSVERQGGIVDTRTGQPAQWGHLPETTQAEIGALERLLAYRLELDMLARRDPEMEAQGMARFAPLPDDDGVAFQADEQTIRDAIERQGKSEGVVRNTLEFLSFRDSIPFIGAAERLLSLPIGSIISRVGEDLSDGRSEVLGRLIAAMPIQGTFTGLRIQTHLFDSWTGSTSDLRDFMAMATALPFVDLFITDKRTCNLAHRALDQAAASKVLRRLTDAADWIEDRIPR